MPDRTGHQEGLNWTVRWPPAHSHRGSASGTDEHDDDAR
jgi:hypothetical protein